MEAGRTDLLNVRSYSGREYQFGELIGSGGEGDVFRIQGKAQVAKIFKNPQKRTEQKLWYMVKHPIQDVQNGGGLSRFAFQTTWPLDILYSDSNNFIGYVMPEISGNLEIISVERGCNLASDRKVLPNYNRAFPVIVACNLAKTVAYLHEQNCIIGDLNPKNFLVTDSGSLVLLDTDSFDLLDPESGIHHRCCVGMEDYLAPELQGRNLESANSVFSVYSDNFGLAIHIFRLLMNDYHPFSGVQQVRIKDSGNVNQRVERIARGVSPFVGHHPGVDIPIGAPRLEEMLPGYLIADFYQTFCYTEPEIRLVEKTRTPAAQWAHDLERFLGEIYDPDLCRICPNDRTHFYLNYQHGCGLCKAAARLRAFQNKH